MLRLVGKYSLFFTQCIACLLFSSHASSNEPFLVQQADTKFPAIDAVFAQDFGVSMASNGKFLFIGAPHDTEKAEAEGDTPGAVFVYELKNGSWSLEDKLFGDQTDALDEFGTTIAVVDDILVVGAPQDLGVGLPQNPEDNIRPAGAVYIFKKNQNDQWLQQTQLVPAYDDNEIVQNFTEDLFGTALAYDGIHLVIGAPTDRNLDAADAGSISIFARDDNKDGINDWTLKIKILASGADNFYGQSVAISNNRIAVGAPRFGINDQGAIAIHEQNTDCNNCWGVEDDKVGTGDDNEQFGASVALDGDVLVVGEPGDEIFAMTPNAGSISIFYRDGVNWSQEKQIFGVNETNANFGNAVSLLGGYLAVGANAADVDVNSNAGLVRIYQQHKDGNLDSWGSLNTVVADQAVENDSNAGDNFGSFVGLSANFLLIGAENDDDDPNDNIGNPGAGYLFEIKNNLFSDGFES